MFAGLSGPAVQVHHQHEPWIQSCVPRACATKEEAPIGCLTPVPLHGARSQLIESWLDGIFKNKDYRTLRVCTPYQGLGGPAGVQTCYKCVGADGGAGVKRIVKGEGERK